MIISRTPFRVSFFGRWYRLPQWYLDARRPVLATTINKYCYITCRHRPPFLEHRIRLAYSRSRTARRSTRSAHPVIREVLSYLDLDEGLEIHHDADLPGAAAWARARPSPSDCFRHCTPSKGEMVSKQAADGRVHHIEQELLERDGRLTGSDSGGPRRPAEHPLPDRRQDRRAPADHLARPREELNRT